ncbi:hypothetical protein QFC22_003119 [Naganishia vaughanmartiniae]|uniref:Uncharacterized protein n=1 Tax=Naganishia vaughanmartiniae TaxID=1424756 RepID=A0ACC2X830_9TREE|nr:hypothetical protein QFC22_003119 [Naganishia vaughanmartiniae]
MLNMFLYYRRRRLRYYQGGEEWPFPTLPANGRASRRRKDEKDFGETPEMYECLLDVQSGVGAKEILASSETSQDVWGGTRDITERSQMMPTIAMQDDDIAQWQPVTVTSLSTKTLSGPAITSAQPVNSGSAVGQSGRPSNLFSRTLSTSRNMFALGGVTQVDDNHNDNNAPAVDQRHSTFTPSSGSTEIPLSVTYLIAMPSALRDTSTAHNRPHQSGGLATAGMLADEEDQEEIPEVALGSTNIHLTIPGLSTTSTRAVGQAAPAMADTLNSSRVNIFRKSETTQQHQQTVAGGAHVGHDQTSPRNLAIGPDGTLDLVALLNQ